MDFLIDGRQKIKRHFSENQGNDIYLCGNTLYILLPRRYTSGISLRVQVGGRTSNGDSRQLVWTPLSETVVFGRSINAGYGCGHAKDHDCQNGGDDGCGHGHSDILRDLITDAHWHGNMETLGLIGVDGEGGLTVDGQPLFQLVAGNAALAGILTRLDAIEGTLAGTAAALNPQEGGSS